MIDVMRVGAWPVGWADLGRRIAAAPRSPAVAGALLGLLAVAESIARSAGGAGSGQLAVVRCLVALSTTVPLAFLGPLAAAVAISAACMLSLALFDTLTVAGLAAELIVLYRLGIGGPRRGGAQLLAMGLAWPFLALALAGGRPADSEAGVLTVLLASLGPVAAGAGIARRARSEALAHSAEQEVIAGTLLEHTARGERARIVRELHDVVAHHISLVAVQAETARLATPGMPAAGAQRLSGIRG